MNRFVLVVIIRLAEDVIILHPYEYVSKWEPPLFQCEEEVEVAGRPSAGR